jgi:DNA-binding NtrC family response regulator
MHPPTLLLVSHEPVVRSLVEQALHDIPATILSVETTDHALQLLRETPTIGLVLCDERDGSIACHPILLATHQQQVPVPVVVMGTGGSVKSAVETMRQGAADYLSQPVTREDLRASLLRVWQHANDAGPGPEYPAPGFDEIVSRSPQMGLIKRLAAEVARTDATVLITGESGTGKELLARAIHQASPRSCGPLVTLNCAGIPEHLMESELFGYQRGAFTDAKQSKPGRFQLAQGGTLFLDEIGELSMTAQAKLLRVLESHTIEPLGDVRGIKVDLRVIAATNEDLPAQIKTGKFRLDLYYRLNVYQLRIPPLRERPEDIEPILTAFLGKARAERGCRIRGITPAALTILLQHDWPGNVRELNNVMEWLTITCKEELIKPEHLPQELRGAGAAQAASPQQPTSLLSFGMSVAEVEKAMLEEALKKTGGNVSEASRLLKITRNTLRYRMAKHNLQ